MPPKSTLKGAKDGVALPAQKALFDIKSLLELNPTVPLDNLSVPIDQPAIEPPPCATKFPSLSTENLPEPYVIEGFAKSIFMPEPIGFPFLSTAVL